MIKVNHALGPNLSVVGDDNFFLEVSDAYKQIHSFPTGRRLLEKIARVSHSILIMKGDVSSYVFCNRETLHSRIRFSSLKSQYLNFDLQLCEAPAFVSLAHELIHAYHHARNKIADSNLVDPLVWTNSLEYKVICGMPSKKNERTALKVTENALLYEMGLPMKIGHQFADFEEGKGISERYKRMAQTFAYVKDSPSSFLSVILSCQVEHLTNANHFMHFYNVDVKDSEGRWSVKHLLTPSPFIKNFSIHSAREKRIICDALQNDLIEQYQSLYGTSEIRFRDLWTLRITEEEAAALFNAVNQAVKSP